MSTTGLLRSMKAKLSGGQSKTKPGSSSENKQGGGNPGKQNATTITSQSNNATNPNVKAENIIAGPCGNQGYEPICSREEMVEAYKGKWFADSKTISKQYCTVVFSFEFAYMCCT